MILVLLACIAFGSTMILGAQPVRSQTRTQPVGSLPPDSVMTPERRRAEEARKQQQAILAKEAEQRRQDSIRNAMQEQQEIVATAQQLARQDSAKAAARIAELERQRLFMLTPMPWKAIGLGGGIGIGSVHMILNRKGLTPTSVFAWSIDASSNLTRRLDVDLSLTRFTVSDEFPGDSVFNHGLGTNSSYSNTGLVFDSAMRLIRGEDLTVSTVALDLRYTITQPSAVVKFYLGLGYGYMTMLSSQRYLQTTGPTSTVADVRTQENSFSRGSLRLMFGIKHDFELGGGYTLTPFAQILAAGVFQGASQDPAFVFRPDADQMIMTHLNAGATLYFGWFGVPRQ